MVLLSHPFLCMISTSTDYDKFYARFQACVVMKVQVAGDQLQGEVSHPEDEGNKVIRNVGILHHYTVPQPRRPRLVTSNILPVAC
jgi:hypothetical protein